MAFNSFIKKNKREKGAIAVFLTLMIITVTLLIAVGLSTIFISETKKSRLVGFTGPAFYAADSGAEYALFQIIKKSSDGASNVPLSLTGSKATVSTSWTVRSVNSLGFFSGTRREVQITW